MDPLLQNAATIVESDRPVPPSDKPSSFLGVALLSALVTAGMAVFLFWQNQLLRNQIALMQSSPTPASTEKVVPPVDPTADWEIYTNTDQNITFKYPKDWELTETTGDTIGGQVYNQNVTLSKDSASISMNFNMNGIGGNGEDLEGQPYILDGNDLYKYSSTTANGSARIGITDELKGSLGVFRANGKTYSISLVYSADVTDSTYEEDFNQILSTFKFTDQQKQQEADKIGYIKSIKPNYDSYLVEVDYVEWINDDNAPNGYRISNPSNQITKLYTDVPGAEPKVTLQTYTLEVDGQVKNQSVTFSQFLTDYQNKPDKWTNALFVIEDNRGTITSINERYTP